MAAVVIVYASLSGNTEEMAMAISRGVLDGGIKPDVKSVTDVSANELLRYDGLLLGAYTWRDGELPDEFLDFYEAMNSLDLQGRKAAVFGSADARYPLYGEAIHILIRRLAARGAVNVLEGLKLELNPTVQEIEECRIYGRKFAQLLLGDA